MDVNSLCQRRAGMLAVATILVLSMLSACGGKGGYSDTATVSNGSNQDAVTPGGSKLEFVLADPEGGLDGLASFDTNGIKKDSLSLAVSTQHATRGSASVAATLNADAAMIGRESLPLSDWRGYRSLLVDIYSDRAIVASDIALVTKSGPQWSWCALPAAQGVKAGAKTTLSFPLDWHVNANCDPGVDQASVRAVYLKIGGGAGNVVYVDNFRVTKAVRAMALGDSITGSPGCWRKKLLDGLSATTLIDMVGVRRNASDCGGDWDSESAAFGGMRVTTDGASIGLAGARRTDTVKTSDGNAAPGNLEVWLEQTRPDLVMMNLGTNDLGGNATPASILAGYDSLLAQMRASNPKAHLLVAKVGLFNPRTPAWTCPDCPARAAAFNTALDAWAQCATTVDSPVAVVDLATGWDEASMTNDGVHPNDMGHVAMARLWKSSVETGYANFDQMGPRPAGWCSAPGPDIANGTASGGTYTITSFKTDLGSFEVLDNAAKPTADATARLDTVAAHANEGSYSARVTITAQPVGGWTGFASMSNGGVANWSGYKFLKFDVKTADTPFEGSVVVQTGTGWTWCEGPKMSIGANAAGTVALDLSTCSGADWSMVGRFQLAITGQPGTFYIDNVRLDGKSY